MLIERRKTEHRVVFVSFVLAVALNALLLLTGVLPALLAWWTEMVPKPKPATATQVSRVIVAKKSWQSNRSTAPEIKLEQQELRKEEEKKEEEKEDNAKLDGQVVDLAPTPDNRPPENARFLSEHNTRVEKETVSRHRRKDYGVAQSRPTIADFSKKSQANPDEQKGQDQVALLTRKQGQQGEKSEGQATILEIPDLQAMQDLQLKLDPAFGKLAAPSPSEAFRGNSQRFRLQLGKQSAENQVAGENGEHAQTVALMAQPSLAHLDMVTGAPANDHVREVPEGEETLLNSREFKYATFFNRIKRMVSEQWNPGQVYGQNDPYGNIYGVKDRYTLLFVEMNSRGELTNVRVTQSSGMEFLDDEAQNAFRQASPFPNPPVGMLEEDGLIRFPFGFYFEIGERTRIRAFDTQRYPGSRF